VAGNPTACEYTWLDPITAPRDNLGVPLYDLFMALQDRTFSDDGSINFSNGLGQPQAVPAVPGAANYPACLVAVPPAANCSPPGNTPWVNGVNPQVHPAWVPEYFADHALVNGVIWPKKTVSPGWYRIRLVDGADARCFTLGFGTVEPGYSTATAAAKAPIRNVTFDVIATEQGYLPSSVTNRTSLTMCPGERYEVLVNFGGTFNAYTDPVTGLLVAGGKLAGRSVYMNNTGAAPFPAGIPPQQLNSPFSELASIMRFDVLGTGTAAVPGVPSCPVGQGATWPGDATNGRKSCIDVPPQIDLDFLAITGLTDCPKDSTGLPITTGGPCVAAARQLFLNEHVDATTLASTGLQINGVSFENDVTETPRQGTYERWQIINATVDAHPIHPHLIKAQIISRQRYNKGLWLKALCGTTTCEPGAAPGGVQVLAPDVTPFLIAGTAVAPPATEAGWKDVMRAEPGQVLTFIAKWDGGWKQPGLPTGDPRSCSVVNNTTCFEPVTAGPYMWHCHINSHEDSEMMRPSLVIK